MHAIAIKSRNKNKKTIFSKIYPSISQRYTFSFSRFNVSFFSFSLTVSWKGNNFFSLAQVLLYLYFRLSYLSSLCKDDILFHMLFLFWLFFLTIHVSANFSNIATSFFPPCLSYTNSCHSFTESNQNVFPLPFFLFLSSSNHLSFSFVVPFFPLLACARMTVIISISRSPNHILFFF